MISPARATPLETLGFPLGKQEFESRISYLKMSCQYQ